MSALVLVAALLSQAPARGEAELGFAYGLGARSAFGGLASGAARWTIYETKAVRGDVEAGVLGGYQYEPYGLTAAFVRPTLVTGGTHRVEVFATGGHTLALFESRRLEVGLALFAGITWVGMRGRVVSAEQGFDRPYSADGAEFTFGLAARVGVRITERVSVVARFILPVPYAGVAISSYFVASAGVSLAL